MQLSRSSVVRFNCLQKNQLNDKKNERLTVVNGFCGHLKTAKMFIESALNQY